MADVKPHMEKLPPQENAMALSSTTVKDQSFLVAFFSQLIILMKRNTILQQVGPRLYQPHQPTSTPSPLPMFPPSDSILEINFVANTVCPFDLPASSLHSPGVFLCVVPDDDQADYANQRASVVNPPPSDLFGVLNCQGLNPNDACINIMYTPQGDSQFDGIMQTFSTMNSNRTGQTAFAIESPLSDLTFVPSGGVAGRKGIVPVASSDFIYSYAVAHPNVTKWGITFTRTQTTTLNIAYQVWYNYSNTANGTDVFGREVVSFIRGMDEAIITYLNDPTATVKSTIDVEMKDWPLIPLSVLSDSIVQSLGACFFFCSEMIIFIIVLNTIVGEKELKLRNGMEMMGLKPSVYWISQYLSNSILVFLAALVTVCLGWAFGFSAFKNTDFGVSLVTFFLFGEAMVMFAFFLTTFISKARIAILAGIFVFVIGLLFESFVFSSSTLGYIWWAPSVVDPLGWKILVLFPFFNFGHMFLDISTLTTGRLDTLTQTFIPGPGFPWSSLYTTFTSSLLPTYNGGVQPDLPAPVQAWYFMLMNVLLYGVLTWYFDCVIPNELGYRQPFYFPLTFDYWGIRFSRRLSGPEWLARQKKQSSAPPEADEDSEVAAERKAALDENDFPAVKIVNLRKVFGQNVFAGKYSDGRGKVAVRDLCINFQEGKLLAMLGQNGAGKSTSINILCGLTKATAGDAMIFGLSVKNQMHLIRKIMGVCPQHDILFDDLTAREHIELYAGLKGVPRSQHEQLIQERLAAVRLLTVQNQRSATYSGGMKRRLSMVISTIGDPRIIFMDEPTTGMDPVNRRHVWTFVEKFKKNRVIVLTTHSMEEADVLGDKIAIMAHGRLRAIDTSLGLKSKFGAGYRISIVTDPNAMDVVKTAVKARVPDAVLEDDSAGALTFVLPLSSTPAIPAFVKEYLDSNPDVIRSWGISQSSLEEVFLKIIRASNPKGYNRVD
ncbi:hypothetical protein SmJEL517_g04789 [Synchytrium microbalum]|uniref:ABC transporter domain-containing protein n=1 Tax=Synchytrium microbalum TaxID=1806994 RepID=A0A507C3I1_9FUNG|nr:uncharacterized protein SmJEL517_g04789 [Synchytrium microbalum]TPX32073.1 hypothetical protein SmJEL517_g04789 [Synchytrium microbalum]